MKVIPLSLSIIYVIVGNQKEADLIASKFVEERLASSVNIMDSAMDQKKNQSSAFQTTFTILYFGLVNSWPQSIIDSKIDETI